MASRVCETKISLISLITEDKQWFLSHHGLEARETPKEYAFCAHAINTPNEPFIIEDARKDRRFHDNPLTAGPPDVIFYAGIPLVSSSGYPLGTLCAIDDRPKKLSDNQIAELKKLAKLCVELFEKRKNEFKNNALLAELNDKNELLKETQDIHQIGNWELDIHSNQVKWSDQVYEIHEVDIALDINKLTGINFYHPDYRDKISRAIENCILNGQPFDMECLLITAKRNQKWVRATGRKVNQKLVGSFQDITEIKSSNYKQKLILEGTNVGTWEWNVQTGETIYNDRWAEIVGYTLEELAPISIERWIELVHPDDLEESEKRLNACIEGKSEFYELEARMKHKDGYWVWVYDRGKVLEWTEDGKPLWMYGTHQDISGRKRAEEEIKRTNLLLEAAQQIAKMGAWEIDTVTNATFWTEEVYKIHEVDSDFDHNMTNAIDFFHPDYRPILTEAISNSILNQIPFDVKCKFITAKNDLRWVRSSGYPILKEGKVVKLIGMFRDITEEEDAKEAIIREQAFSKQLLENMADGFSVVDTYGKQIGVNKALLEMTGFSEEELIGQTAPYPYWPAEEMDKIGVAFRQALAGVKNSFELILQKKNGQRFPALVSLGILKDENGKPISYFANIKDISYFKEAEMAIIQSKEQYQSLVQNIPGITYRCKNDKDWTNLYISNQVDSITGYHAEELIGNAKISYGMLIHPDDQEKVAEVVSTGLANNNSWEMEYRIQHKDGFYRWAYEKGTGVKNKQGEIIYLDGFVLDITDRKKDEEEIKSLLIITREQNNRLKNFAHIVSHNLRSHSSGIYGLLELLHFEKPEFADFEIIKLLKSGTESLKKTVEDLTEIVKVNLNMEELQEIQLVDIICKNINSMSSQISIEKIKIINEVSEKVKVKGVAAYIDSIVLNMITNAIKYKSESRDATLRIFCEEEYSFVHLYFQDNGLGIDLKKHGDKLFGLYKTFHNHHDSRGLGLFMTKNQVESIGGKISVESEVNIGTTFKITFKK
ncbi:PAS domain-containing protein [Belliella kenyensis]|uniref:histidine kinase n=2 Tax=Belliella kenyensis TaxID=1472724 RepID=A0ABV8EPW1_9BACT|nr:PAS domain-containing protein [Belliella kenyensis]